MFSRLSYELVCFPLKASLSDDSAIDALSGGFSLCDTGSADKAKSSSKVLIIKNRIYYANDRIAFNLFTIATCMYINTDV